MTDDPVTTTTAVPSAPAVGGSGGGAMATQEILVAMRTALVGDDPEMPPALTPLATLTAAVQYACDLREKHRADEEDPDASWELLSDANDDLKALAALLPRIQSALSAPSAAPERATVGSDKRWDAYREGFLAGSEDRRDVGPHRSLEALYAVAESRACAYVDARPLASAAPEARSGDTEKAKLECIECGYCSDPAGMYEHFKTATRHSRHMARPVSASLPPSAPERGAETDETAAQYLQRVGGFLSGDKVALPTHEFEHLYAVASAAGTGDAS